jgi:hypothetical protein
MMNGTLSVSILCNLGIDALSACAIVSFVNKARKTPPKHCLECGKTSIGHTEQLDAESIQ